MAPKPPSPGERLMLLPNVGRILLAVVLRLLSRPFLGESKQESPLKDALYAGLRKNLIISTVAQEQYTMGTTESAYKRVAKRHGTPVDSETLASGIKVHWIGSKTAEKVILFFHGGGYVLPATPGHWEFLFDLQKWLSKDRSISIVVPAYTLAPEAQYPGQLKEAVESLAYLFEQQHRRPRDIVIGGDSAGGNLTLALFSHLLHPHPEVKERLGSYLTEPFPAAVLISPWAEFLPEGGSAETNTESDYVSEIAAHRWSKAFKGDTPTNNYLEPARADEAWFSGLDKHVKEVLVWAGGAELLVDSIKRLADLLSKVHNKVSVVVQPGSGHEDFIMTRLIRLPHPDDHAKVVSSWIASRL